MSFITGAFLYDIIAVLITLITVFIVYSKWTFQYWKDRGVPYFEPTILWGNLRPPHRRVVSIGDEIAELYKNAKDKGWKHLGWYNMINPIYMPLDLNLIKHILTKDFNHFVDRGVYSNEKGEPITAHLFAIGGKKWRNLRTKFTPTFTSGKMRNMFQTIADCGVQLNKYLVQELTHHEPIDIKNILGNFSTDVIGSCAFGIECNSFKDPDNPFRIMGKRILNRTRFETLMLIIANNFQNFARFVGIRLLDKNVSDFFTKVVGDTVNYREKNQVHRHDFLQLLIEIKNKKEDAQQPGLPVIPEVHVYFVILNGTADWMSQFEHPVQNLIKIRDGTSLTLDEMVAQSFVFFIAGFETSSTTMSFALYELANHQDIQQKVREEIDRVLKKHNGEITYDSLNEMKYMSQVIDETLRMYPAVPFITRLCVEDYVVPETYLTLKKGTRVFIPIKGIHYDEEYYPNPDVFDPDRFLEEDKHDRNQYSYLPFGEGPRICIGMRFGIMQTKVGLINILKNFKVTLNKKTKTPMKLDVNSFIPQVDGGIWLDMENLA